MLEPKGNAMFEDSEVAVADAPEIETTTTAVAAPASSGLVASGKKPTNALATFLNRIDPYELDRRAFPRLKASLEGFLDEKDNSVGKCLRLAIESYNYGYVVSTGDQGGESNKLVRFSIDGINLENGEGLCADYIDELKAKNFPKADMKTYVYMYGFVEAFGDKDAATLKEIAPEDQEIYMIQVPPMSVATFQGFCVTQGIKLSRGVGTPVEKLIITQNSVKGASALYATLNFAKG